MQQLAAGQLDLTPDALVLVTAVLEYVCADMLQAAGNEAIETSNERIISLDDILQTIENDEELSTLFFVVSPASVARLSRERKSAY